MFSRSLAASAGAIAPAKFSSSASASESFSSSMEIRAGRRVNGGTGLAGTIGAGSEITTGAAGFGIGTEITTGAGGISGRA